MQQSVFLAIGDAELINDGSFDERKLTIFSLLLMDPQLHRGSGPQVSDASSIKDPSVVLATYLTQLTLRDNGSFYAQISSLHDKAMDWLRATYRNRSQAPVVVQLALRSGLRLRSVYTTCCLRCKTVYRLNSAKEDVNAALAADDDDGVTDVSNVFPLVDSMPLIHQLQQNILFAHSNVAANGNVCSADGCGSRARFACRRLVNLPWSLLLASNRSDGGVDIALPRDLNDPLLVGPTFGNECAEYEISYVVEGSDEHPSTVLYKTIDNGWVRLGLSTLTSSQIYFLGTDGRNVRGTQRDHIFAVGLRRCEP